MTSLFWGESSLGIHKSSRQRITMKMEVSNMHGSSLILQRQRPNQAVHSPGLDKSGSFNTATTSEEISLDDFASPGKGKSPISNFVSTENVTTPSKKKSMMTMSVTSKNQKAPELNLSNEDSFKEADDSSWWQSPKVPKDGDMIEIEEKTSSQLDHFPESRFEVVKEVTSEKPNSIKKATDKKKKVKRISMIKVKACDLGSLGAHQFTKSGDFATDQKELQKALMQWKAEQKNKAGGGSSPHVVEDGSPEERKRSKSKVRGAKEEVETSDEALHRRSRSTGRRSPETEVVDLTSEDKRSKSVSRRSSNIPSSEKSRSRSVARKESAEDDDRQKPDEKSDIRSRGRSVGAKRTSKESEEKSRGKSLVRTSSGKATRERSRSVARQRPCDEMEDDEKIDDKKESTNRDHSVARTRSSDLEIGLKKVDRDTRSRSVARQRPNEEDINSHSNSAHSLHSSKSKSTAKSEKTNESIQSDQSADSSEKKRRSKSLIRKTRKLEENYLAPSRGRSSGSEPVSSDDEGTRRKRSASLGAGLTRASSSLKANEATEKRESSVTNQDGKTGPHPSPSKSIPWNEFLMHAQSTTCS